MAWESDPSEHARPFQMGMAARNGVTAALLAGAGFGGPRHVFDHGHTVFKAFSRTPRPELLTRELGARWDGIAEFAIKPYPCVSFLHPALDALFGLVAEHDLDPEEIESLVLRFPRAGVHCIDANPLKSHCAQYVLPVALARRRLEVGDLFEDRRESDPLVRALAARVRVEPDDGALAAAFPDAYASELVLRTSTGRTLRRRSDIARGYPEAPLGKAEIEAKLAGLVGSERGPRLARRVAELPAAPDVEGYALELEGEWCP
jgi:2-methylcitrate dehydratase PrpD